MKARALSPMEKRAIKIMMTLAVIVACLVFSTAWVIYLRTIP